MTPATTPLLQFKNATVIRAGQTVLNNINWTVLKNENWLIIGPMASGKTTLLEAVAGQLPVKSGEANFTPVDLRIDRWELPKFITLASFRNQLVNGADFYYQQRYNFVASEQVPTVSRYLGTYDFTDARIKALRINELLHLELVKLSNGQTRRVILAKALLSQPALLLLDNPFAGLDTETRADLHQLIEELLRHRQRIMLTCTYLEDIPQGFTHVLYMQHNNIAFQGPLKDGIDFARRSMAANVMKNTSRSLTALPLSGNTFEKAVELKNVTVRYGSKLVLDNVNWTVKRNEKWALMGKNGSGKSSLLSLLNADNPQAYGNDILLFDEKRTYGRSIWHVKKRIGFFSPELQAYFNEDLSVIDTLATGYTDTFVPRKNITAEEEQRMHNLLAFYSIEHLSLRRYRHLSSGEQRLILFLRSLVKTVDLLILDEPFQGFDRSLIEQSRMLINQYCRDTTLIIVTHYREEIPSCVTKVLTLKEGRVLNNCHMDSEQAD
jgi:molybdate transport system ATP-binding protein